MKNLKKIILTSGIMLSFLSISYSQNVDDNRMQEYIKQNFEITNFKRLGVNQKHYAKCIESYNYEDPNKKMKIVSIDQTEFRDDGENFDLVANDGILTSRTLTEYAENETPVQIGFYQDSKEAISLVDKSFAHRGSKNSSNKFKIEIACDFFWVKCKDLPPMEKIVCEIAGWPYGVLKIKNCRLTVSF